MADAAPVGIVVLRRCFGGYVRNPRTLHTVWVLLLTFLVYMFYHAIKRPIAGVKATLAGNRTVDNRTVPGWAPFNESSHGDQYLGLLDTSYLFSYAISMYLSGYLAEHINLRWFLGISMILCGTFTGLFGLGYFCNIHAFWYFLFVQIVSGVLQSSGWPSVVSAAGNWVGKGRRGWVMGLWNAHTSVGNIVGLYIAAIWAENKWGWSFIVPGVCAIVVAIMVLLFLVPDPEDVSLLNPNQVYREVNCLMKDNINEIRPVRFTQALLIPGVIEYSISLFFAKLVSYSFLFWLPYYIEQTEADKGKGKFANHASLLSGLFDVGGFFGGFLAGLMADITDRSGLICVTMSVLAAPTLYLFHFYGDSNWASEIALIILSGFLVNGPYSLITTAVSANLGIHPCLSGSTKAMATVSAIIDGTGSLGAAIGPMLISYFKNSMGWNAVIYFMISSSLVSALFLVRQLVSELRSPRLMVHQELTQPLLD